MADSMLSTACRIAYRSCGKKVSSISFFRFLLPEGAHAERVAVRGQYRYPFTDVFRGDAVHDGVEPGLELQYPAPA